MHVLVQIEQNTSSSVDKAVGLVGTYNTYEDASAVMRALLHRYQYDGVSSRCGVMDACVYDPNEGVEWHWFIFDANEPEWFVNW